MIKNIIFDIGDVLMRFTWNDYVTELFKGDTTRINAVNEAINKTGLWIELDKNIMTEEETISRMLAYDPASSADVKLALDNARLCFNRLDYSVPWVKELKVQGYNVYFLSNYSKFNIKAAPEVLDFIQYMDGGVFSCDVQLIKPDPAIYQYLWNKYQLTPNECIFIDDRIENVEAAISLGMQAIHFTGYPETKEALDKLLQA